MPANQEAAAEFDPAPHGRSRAGRMFTNLRERGQRVLRARAWRLRLFGLLALQAGIAAAIAWFVAYQFLGNASPVFAPTTAVGIVAASMGSRLRRTIELLGGVVLGLAVGDTLMPLFGIGPWQTGAVVVLAIIVAILFKGSGSLLTQAGGTAVLIATLEPPVRDLSVPRFVDAAVGGLIGLAVGPRLTALDEGLFAAQEVVRLAPLRWRDRPSLAFYTQAVRHLERSLHGCRSIARRLTTALKDDEPIPDELPAAIDLLATGVQTLRCAVRSREEPGEAREQILAAVELAGRAQGHGSLDANTHRLGYSGLIAVGLFRMAAHDLLIASGLDADRAAGLVRRAVDRDEQD